MIFSGAVMALGGAIFGVVKINKRQLAAANQYRSEQARHDREKRITDMVKDIKEGTADNKNS